MAKDGDEEFGHYREGWVFAALGCCCYIFEWFQQIPIHLYYCFHFIKLVLVGWQVLLDWFNEIGIANLLYFII
jgi:hypothetical protein